MRNIPSSVTPGSSAPRWRHFVSITIPVFNEEKVLAESVSTLIAFLSVQPEFRFEIVIANNGSTDGTLSLAEELSQKYSVIRVMDIAESGRGRALKQAWSGSAAEILVYMDVDLATDLGAFWPMISALTEGQCDVVTGSRRIAGSIVERSAKRKFLSDVFHILLKSLFTMNLSDTQCGFKGITKKAAVELLADVLDTGWLFDTELLFLAEKRGYRIREIPVVWRAGTESRVKIGQSIFTSLVGMLRLRCRKQRHPCSR